VAAFPLRIVARFQDAGGLFGAGLIDGDSSVIHALQACARERGGRSVRAPILTTTESITPADSYDQKSLRCSRG
jgi:hypothetical protein